MKELKDYLHLYLGCEIKFKRPSDKLYTVTTVGQEEIGYRFSDMKLLLRPLSDMTEEERGEFLSLNTTRDNKEQCEANNTVWLLSNHFDLFGLIESGLAIDKTKTHTT